MDDAFDIYLASGSPRRRELLTQLGIGYRVVHAAVDETPHTGELARDYVQRLALAKAQAGQRAVQTRHPVLGADTAVILDDCILGKPSDKSDFVNMLQRLSGRVHGVLTAVALVVEGRVVTILSTSRVCFRPLSDAEIEAYWRTGEPVDKAGGYAVQGLAAAFIERIEGSYSGIMGLPLFETSALLQTLGISVLCRQESS